MGGRRERETGKREREKEREREEKKDRHFVTFLPQSHCSTFAKIKN